MSEFAGSYLGFTYDGVHSSDLGIVRVSNSGRYSENLLPDIQDKTTQVPGADGTYYYGTYYTKRSFNVPIAFDNLSNTQLRELQRRFGEKGIHKLVFDENPYKEWFVKATGTPNLKYVAFDRYTEHPTSIDRKEDLYGTIGADFYEGGVVDSASGRIYKGEGTLNLVAFVPYAHSRYKYADDYLPSNMYGWGNNIYYNEGASTNQISEWWMTARLLRSDYTKTIGSTEYQLDEVTENGCLVYNPGDLPTPFKFKIRFSQDQQTIPTIKLQFGDNQINTKQFTLDPGDYGVQINTELHLIEGLDDTGAVTGKVYNQYISSGDFFKLPLINDPELMTIVFGSSIDATAILMDYKYLYY